jgi:predicted transposase
MLGMKLIAQVKLLPAPEQADALRHTLEQANVACRFVSDTAWETKTFRQYDLHHKCYKGVREQFGLSAQVQYERLPKSRMLTNLTARPNARSKRLAVSLMMTASFPGDCKTKPCRFGQ